MHTDQKKIKRQGRIQELARFLISKMSHNKNKPDVALIEKQSLS